ncbi:hypothetical protein F5Y16DRAFT_287456 [Xylariaceae sp. FL0255]|nr:hypothetical protein F5Y16DRAFT_287456 [Xylariaceae sp. FL0255]
MEKKRKLPPRAAARVESASKKQRNITATMATSDTPPPKSASPQPPEPIAREPTPTPALPTSLQPGQPLPTVEKPQPDDLPLKDYQSIQESGVMAESLNKSRQTWLDDGVFEKYWTKPSKRKGAMKEDPNNPSKDTMTKIGQVHLKCAIHDFPNVTLFAVKDTKPPPPTTSSVRPILQYGPPNGIIPPPLKPSTSTTPSAAPIPAVAPALAEMTAQTGQASQPALLPSQPAQPTNAAQFPPSVVPATELRRPSLPASNDNPSAASRGLEGVLAPPPTHAAMPAGAHSLPHQPAHIPPSQPHGPPQPAVPTQHVPVLYPPGAGSTPVGPGGAEKQPAAATVPPPPAAAKPAPTTAPGADPIIVNLAEKATLDPNLRDLMKRVAVGEAAPDELAHFQSIIDQITLEYKQNASRRGPAAETMMVNGKSVKHYADQGQKSIDIVLASYPNQKGKDLKLPPKCDLLLGFLMKKALDEPKFLALVRRLANGNVKFTDSTELHAELQRMQRALDKESERIRNLQSEQQTTGNASSTSALSKLEDLSSGSANGAVSKKAPVYNAAQTPNAPAAQQALRSKGPPPMTKPEIAAIVMDFGEKNSDRYLFPKFSILQFSADGTEVVASFLLVRRGSVSDSGGNPKVDFYEKVTMTLRSNSPRILENLARVVAPQDEVQRYMDDVMDNMTPAEYVCLAMRLVRGAKDDSQEDPSDTTQPEGLNHTPQPEVLWNTKISPQPGPSKSVGGSAAPEESGYQNFISTIS